MDDDEELLQAIHASTKRGRAVVVRPVDAEARAKIVRSIARSYGPARARSRRALFARGAIVASGLALAAAVAVVVRPSRSGELPAYELIASGGARDVRGAVTATAGGPLRLRDADRFEVVLRPATDAPGPLAARAFLVRGASIIPFAGAVDVAANGAIRFAGSARDFPGVTAGAAELVIAVGRADAIAAGDAASLVREGPDHRVLRTPVAIE
jgi:hypothetical protein